MISTQTPQNQTRIWAILASILIGTLIGTMGNSLVSIALPSFVDHFNVPLTSAVWSITVYTLTFSVLIPVFGVLGPAIGYKRLYLGGTGLVCISSLLCVVSPNFWLFLLARVLLGVGVATVLPTIMGIVANQFPPETQGKATGYWALVNSFGHAIGPPLGGLLLQHFNWQSIFLINLPLGIISIILVARLMPADRRIPIESFDVAGAASLTGLAFCAIFAITQTAKAGFQAVSSISLWIGAILSLVSLLYFERKVRIPFVNLKLFSNIRYVSSIVPISLQAFSQFGLLVSLPFFLIDLYRMDGQLAGLIIMSMTLTMAILSPVAGRLCDIWGSKIISLTGTLCIIAATIPFFLLRFFELSGWAWVLFISGLLIFGLGFGFIQSSATVAVIHAVPKDLAGAASGFFHMIRFISASLGSTIVGIILEMNSSGMTDGFFISFWLILALGILTIPFTLKMPARV